MRKALFSTLFLLLLSNIFAIDVRVLIVENKNNISVNASGPITIKAADSSKNYKTKKAGIFKISTAGGSLKAGNLESKKGFLITPSSKTIFTINNNKYEGSLTVEASKNGVNIIEQIDLENYLCGVLPYEMSYSWHTEALKAQAVAARTYTLKEIEGSKSSSFDLYSDVRSQMYKGSATKYDSVKEAVEQTKGEVLKYKDELFFTYYHANCGGHTDPIPWLQEVPKPLQGAKCGYCKESKSADWQYTVPQADINKFLVKNKISGTIKSVKIGKKYSSGRAKTLIIKTTKQKKEVSCNDFRVGVGSTKCKSCFITKIDGFTFTGKGYGHGGGMCQDGAHGMAKAGKDYKDILEQFYPSSKLTGI